ncbi:polymer-forming cytoskeletal protein [Halococcus hamelinensis]|uniref:Acyltransferase n=1 Tax=Halococcus hamelinensis 100A6 TaxID=1132509 RepID=M0M0D2_9EURY|nr:polymer-forming cytoskeletal protein [Halococcus hamelinensis]EMA38888.1 hypothetical protein C447_08698 [Halococcus hamelinensis 100A6]
MSFRSDPLSELVVPDGTTVEEHDIVTDADVIVGTQSTISLGVRARNVVAGERVTFDGDIEASADCRLDMWCAVDGNVLVGADAYIGERVEIGGQLVVAGDLDIGDDVTIEEGFDANGWIVIRNPVPTLVFLFTYLTHLLRRGEEELADDVLSEVFEGHDDQPLVVPKNATLGDDAWRVSTPARVGDDCRLHGNLRAESITVGANDEIFGSLRARESITLDRGTVVHGDVTTSDGAVEVAAEAHIRGDIACERLRLHEGAVVEGQMRARGEMTVVRAQRGVGTSKSDTETEAVTSADDVDGTVESDDERTEPDGSKGSFTPPE